MTITLPNGNTIDIIPSDDSARYAELQGDEYVELRFESAEHIELKPNSSITFNGETYYIERPQDVRIVHRRNYEYVARFESMAARLKFLPFINPDDERITFAVTGYLSDHLDLIKRSANKYSSGWTIGSSTNADKDQKVISYDSLTIWEAISLIAETFDTEFEIAGQEINIKKVQYNKANPLAIKYGRGNGLLSGIQRSNYGDNPPIIGAVIKGSSQNLNTSSNSEAYGDKTLHCPDFIANGVAAAIAYDGTYFAYPTYSNGSYQWSYHFGWNAASARYFITALNGHAVYYAGDSESLTMPNITHGHKIETIDLSDIYPQLTHTIANVTSQTAQDSDNEDYTQYTIYIDEDINYNDLRIASEQLKIVFQSGMLTGKEFEIGFKDTAQYQQLTIIPEFIDDERMPSEIFAPAVGDKFKVFGCMLPQQYIREDSNHSGAEWDLLRAAVEHLHENAKEHYTWRADIDGIWSENLTSGQFAKMRIGGYVEFTDLSVQPDPLLIRIIAIKQPLNHPKWLTLTLADFAEFGRRRTAILLGEMQQQVSINKIELQTNSNANNLNTLNVAVQQRPTMAQMETAVVAEVAKKQKVKSGTIDYWTNQRGYIPDEGDIIIYTDAWTDDNKNPVARIKIGTGNAYVQDLAFADEESTNRILKQIPNRTSQLLNDTDLVSIDDDNEVERETLILTKNNLTLRV